MVEPESSYPVNKGPVGTIYVGNNLALSLKLSTCMPTSQPNSISQDQCLCLCLGLRTRKQQKLEVIKQQTVMEYIP